MRRLFLILGLLCPTLLTAQQWSSILSPNRAISWESTDGVVGGIPTDRTAVCTTLSSTATAAQINTAIANCNAAHLADAGGIVQLNAGTYNVGGIVMQSNVTLRGVDPIQTVLQGTGTAGCMLGNQCFLTIEGVGTFQGGTSNCGTSVCAPAPFSVPTSNLRNVLGTD